MTTRYETHPHQVSILIFYHSNLISYNSILTRCNLNLAPHQLDPHPQGWGPDWHLALIEVRHNGTGETTMFPCDNWLCEDSKAAGGGGGGHLGGKLERMLLAGVGEEGREVADGQRRYVISTAGCCQSKPMLQAPRFSALNYNMINCLQVFFQMSTCARTPR